MTFDIPGMVAIAPVLLAVARAIRHSNAAPGKSRGKRILPTFGGFSIRLLQLNLVRPCGSGA